MSEQTGPSKRIRDPFAIRSTRAGFEKIDQVISQRQEELEQAEAKLRARLTRIAEGLAAIAPQTFSPKGRIDPTDESDPQLPEEDGAIYRTLLQGYTRLVQEHSVAEARLEILRLDRQIPLIREEIDLLDGELKDLRSDPNKAAQVRAEHGVEALGDLRDALCEKLTSLGFRLDDLERRLPEAEKNEHRDQRRVGEQLYQEKRGYHHLLLERQDSPLLVTVDQLTPGEREQYKHQILLEIDQLESDALLLEEVIGPGNTTDPRSSLHSFIDRDPFDRPSSSVQTELPATGSLRAQLREGYERTKITWKAAVAAKVHDIEQRLRKNTSKEALRDFALRAGSALADREAFLERAAIDDRDHPLLTATWAKGAQRYSAGIKAVLEQGLEAERFSLSHLNGAKALMDARIEELDAILNQLGAPRESRRIPTTIPPPEPVQPVTIEPPAPEAAGGASIEFARELLGPENFHGVEDVEHLLGFKIPPEDVPPLPYSEAELRASIKIKEKMNIEEVLVLFATNANGEPLTGADLNSAAQQRYTEVGLGNFLASHMDATQKIIDELALPPRYEWRLITKSAIPFSKNLRLDWQEKAVEHYAKEGGVEQETLKVAEPLEVMYLCALQAVTFKRTKDVHWQPFAYDSHASQTRIPDGRRILVGAANATGIMVSFARDTYQKNTVGTCLVREPLSVTEPDDDADKEVETAETASPIAEGEHEAFRDLREAESIRLRKFFGDIIEVPPVPAGITPEHLRLWKEAQYKLEYWPARVLAPDMTSCPGWKQKPGAEYNAKGKFGIEVDGLEQIINLDPPNRTNPNLDNLSVWMLPGKWILRSQREAPYKNTKGFLYGHQMQAVINEALRAGLLNDATLKKFPDGSWFVDPEVYKSISFREIVRFVLRADGIPNTTVRFPRVIEASVMGQEYSFSVPIWCEEYANRPNRLILGGKYGYGGVSYLRSKMGDGEYETIGMDPIIVFSKEETT